MFTNTEELKIAPTVQTVYPIFFFLPHTISINISLWGLSRKKIRKYFLSFPQKTCRQRKLKQASEVFTYQTIQRKQKNLTHVSQSSWTPEKLKIAHSVQTI